MIRFLTGLFQTPEAQRDPYVWGAVFGAHLAFGMIGWTVIMYLTDNPHLTTRIVICAYFIWEAGQFFLRRTMSIFLDCVLDLVAFSSMAFAVYEVWLNNAVNALFYTLGALAIMAIGVCKRLCRE